MYSQRSRWNDCVIKNDRFVSRITVMAFIVIITADKRMFYVYKLMRECLSYMGTISSSPMRAYLRYTMMEWFNNLLVHCHNVLVWKTKWSDSSQQRKLVIHLLSTPFYDISTRLWLQQATQDSVTFPHPVLRHLLSEPLSLTSKNYNIYKEVPPFWTLGQSWFTKLKHLLSIMLMHQKNWKVNSTLDDGVCNIK